MQQCARHAEMQLSVSAVAMVCSDFLDAPLANAPHSTCMKGTPSAMPRSVAVLGLQARVPGADAFYQIDGECSKCEEGEYFRTQCKKCNSSCATCNSAACLTCAIGLLMNDDATCLTKLCQGGSFFVSQRSLSSRLSQTCQEGKCDTCSTGLIMKRGVITCEDGYEVEENECRLQYTLTAYELVVLRITFNNSLSSTLTSADLTRTANCTDFSALLTTEITFVAYTSTSSSSQRRSPHCRGSRQQDHQRSKSDSAVLLFSMANSTSALTDEATRQVTSSVSNNATAAVAER
jgi:hypothetical protein